MPDTGLWVPGHLRVRPPATPETDHDKLVAAVTAPPRVGRVVSSPLERVRGEPAPPPAWERQLRAVSPVSNAHSYLAMRWHPSERWVLYECVPAALIPPSKLEQLTGTPWWELPKGQQVGRMVSVSAYQWYMYDQHRVWARPFWFIQGTNGGTPARLTDAEHAMAKAMGLPTDVPSPGDLAFAPFDNRVVTQIHQRDRLMRLGMRVEALKASGTSDAIKAEEREAQQQFRREFLAWWTEQMAPGTDFLDWYTRRTEADRVLRKASKAEVNAAAQLNDTYIATGTVPSPE